MVNCNSFLHFQKWHGLHVFLRTGLGSSHELLVQAQEGEAYSTIPQITTVVQYYVQRNILCLLFSGPTRRRHRHQKPLRRSLLPDLQVDIHFTQLCHGHSAGGNRKNMLILNIVQFVGRPLSVRSTSWTRSRWFLKGCCHRWRPTQRRMRRSTRSPTRGCDDYTGVSPGYLFSGYYFFYFLDEWLMTTATKRSPPGLPADRAKS